MDIRDITRDDHDGVWAILEPVFRAGATYAVDPEISRDDALAFWLASHAYVAEDDALLGTYFIRRNQGGGGSHICNAGFVTARGHEGQGISRSMLAHSLEEARRLGYKAMQFNFVVETNTRAVDIWLRAGFREIGRQPEAFVHPTLGTVDALILHKFLD